MRAALLEEPYKLVLKDIKKPIPKPTEVLIEIKVSGVCGSDRAAYEGIHPRRKPPVVLGHEFAGLVVETGEKVTKFSIGDRVTALPRKSCGKCSACKQGWLNLCENKILLGSKKWIGSFSEYIVVPEDLVYKLPDTLDYKYGALVEPLAVGLHAVNKGNVQQGDRIAVLGVGTIGLMCVAAAKYAQVNKILAADIVDFNLEVASALGADAIINSKDEGITNKIKAMSELNSLDIAIVTAPVPELVTQAFSIVRQKGCIVLVAQFDKPGIIDIEKSRLKEQTIVGSSTYVQRDYYHSIDLLNRQKQDFDRILTHHFALDEIKEAFSTAFLK